MNRNRRPPQGNLTFGLRGTNTVYGGGGSTNLGRPILLALIVILGLVLVWFLFSSVCGGGGSCNGPYCSTDRDIDAPEGFELVSDVYELNPDAPEVSNPATVSNGFSVQFPLSDQSDDARNLRFYRFVEATETWEPVTAATLVEGGDAVTGEFRDTPQIVAVLRRLSAAGHVVAYLPAGAGIHPEAIQSMTVLHTFDFRPMPDGTIEGELRTGLPAGNYEHFPVISASAADRAEVATVEAILTVAAARSAHVQAIVARVKELNVPGVDIHYMDLNPQYRAQFSLFISELANALHAANRKLSVTLPPPQLTGDRVDDGAYDWVSIGQQADIVQMAPYRDQSTYRLAMPAILEFLTENIEPSRLVLTVSPFASEKSSDGVRRVSLTEAMATAGKMQIGSGGQQELVTNTNVNIVGTNIDGTEQLTGLIWDKNVACVSYTYKLNGNRTVWIENFFSVGFKLEYVSRFQLGGVAVEDASNDIYLGNIWPAITPFVTSGQPVLMQPNSEDLAPQWEATSGTIAPGPAEGVIIWTTPAEPGSHTIYLTLSDGVALFESQIVADVQPRTSASPTQEPS